MNIRYSLICLIIQYTVVGCTKVLRKGRPIFLVPNTPRTLILKESSAFQQVLVTFPATRNYTLMTLQLHTQYKSISVSFTKTYVYGQTYNSSNPAIFYLLEPLQNYINGYIGSNSTTPVESSLGAVATSGRVPIPGGCCLTCAMELDPNIEITYVNGRASLFFHRASQYYDPRWGAPHCDDSSNPGTYSLKYRVYYYYIEDFTSESLFDAILKMTMPDSIEKYGTFLLELTGQSALRLTLQPIKGQGVVFNVIVYDPKAKLSSSYTPVSTYHCHFTGPNADCYVKKDITSIVYCILCASVGIVLCAAGFKLLHLLMFIGGWLLYWLLTYVFLYLNFIDAADDLSRCDVTERDVMIMSSMCAICGGALTMFLYSFQRTMVFGFVTVGVVVAMFITSIIFYTPIGHLPFWDGDGKFLFAFCCISICVATFFFFIPKFLSIFTSSVLGSYAVILVPNYFFQGSLQYIALIAPLRMRSSLDFFLERPYHLIDYILSGCWILLFTVGMTIQYIISRNKNLDLSDLNPFKRINPTSEPSEPNEHTPLTQNSGNHSMFRSPRHGGSRHTSNEREPLINRNAPLPTAPQYLSNEPPPPYSEVAVENEQSVQYD